MTASSPRTASTAGERRGGQARAPAPDFRPRPRSRADGPERPPGVRRLRAQASLRIMLALAAVLVLVALGIWLYCLFEVLSTDEGHTRHLPKFAWFLIVLLGFELGAVAWLLFG